MIFLLGMMFLLILIAMTLRAVPFLLTTQKLGVDHWYWNLYVQTYRKNKTFPPVISQYLLDLAQWYPPIFPRLLTLLPTDFFENKGRAVAICIDLMRMTLAMGVVYWFSPNNLLSVAITGIAYATSPILISYNVQLNPRGLGALLLDILLALVLFMQSSGMVSEWYFGAAFILAGLIFLTHKMTMQLCCFLCICAAIISCEFWLILGIPLTIFIAWFLSRGFYAKVLMAHWDIVSFWNRNWRWLQSHPLQDSPVYGTPGKKSLTRFHQPGIHGLLRHIRYMVGYCPSLWVFIALYVFFSWWKLDCSAQTFLLVGVIFLTALFAWLTTLVPFLKCLGGGYYYLYNVAFPVAVIWGILASAQPTPEGLWSGILLSLVLSIGSIITYFRQINKMVMQGADHEFEQLLIYLKSAPKGPVLCLPPQWYDIVAYKTGQPVLYGGHGYGFRLLEPVFPRLLISVAEIRERWGLRYIITKEGYLNTAFLADLKDSQERCFGQYILFEFNENI